MASRERAAKALLVLTLAAGVAAAAADVFQKYGLDRQAGEAAARQAAEEKARYEEAKRRPPDPGALSSDPRVALRKSLKSFLAETSGVDFALKRSRRRERAAS